MPDKPSRFSAWVKRRSIEIGALLVLLAVGIAFWQFAVETSRPLTRPEAAFVEFVVVVGSLAGSWLISRGTLRLHVRSAFRRLISLYAGLAQIVASAQEEDDKAALTEIRAVANVHIQTAEDALEDWSDLVPEQVAELRQRLEQVKKPQEEAGPAHGPLSISPGSILHGGGTDDG